MYLGGNYRCMPLCFYREKLRTKCTRRLVLKPFIDNCNRANLRYSNCSCMSSKTFHRSESNQSCRQFEGYTLLFIIRTDSHEINYIPCLGPSCILRKIIYIHLFQLRLLPWTMFHSLQCTMVNPFVAGSLVLFKFIEIMETLCEKAFKRAFKSNGC